MARGTVVVPGSPGATIDLPGGAWLDRPPVVRSLDRIGFAVAATDAALLVGAVLLAHVLRFGLMPLQAVEWVVVGLCVPTWIVTAAAWQLHRSFRFDPVEEFRRVVGAVSLCLVLVWSVSFWSHTSVSRGWIGLSWMLGLGFVLADRALCHAWLRRRWRRGDLRLRTVVVGTTEEGGRIAEALSRSLAYEPVGFLWTGLGDPTLDGLPRLGDLSRLEAVVRGHAADCLFVAPSSVSEEQMFHLIRLSRRLGIELRVGANLPSVYATRVALQPVDRTGGVMSLAIQPVRLTGPQAALKRAFDVGASLLLLVLLSPVFAAIALAVKLDSPGPVLYRQTRATRHGRPFTMLKFRTMREDAEEDLRRHGLDPSRPFFKTEDDDPRITRVGRLLRRTSLDELPQLWHVLRGEMSLVGPRPLPIEQVHANPDLLAARHEVRAGLTGWWQVQGRSDLPLEEALRMDAFYIENWSFALDLWILLRTVGVVLRGEGAR
ncbi:MAG: polyprenyl glycosylphosphotransferase [Actinomycetota bacterium]|nr:MAG: polyprenyl glycosylphosphotransferase [Actinomycetota bacterium]